jgi:ABC-type multidrug transport system ATPase subunit
MDEPTSGLDAFNALALVECVSSLCRQERKAILMTIHQPRDLIMKHFTKIILMGPQGSVVFIGTVSEALIHFDSFGLTCPLQTNPCDCKAFPLLHTQSIYLIK